VQEVPLVTDLHHRQSGILIVERVN